MILLETITFMKSIISECEKWKWNCIFLLILLLMMVLVVVLTAAFCKICCDVLRMYHHNFWICGNNRVYVNTRLPHLLPLFLSLLWLPYFLFCLFHLLYISSTLSSHEIILFSLFALFKRFLHALFNKHCTITHYDNIDWMIAYQKIIIWYYSKRIQWWNQSYRNAKIENEIVFSY